MVYNASKTLKFPRPDLRIVHCATVQVWWAKPVVNPWGQNAVPGPPAGIPLVFGGFPLRTPRFPITGPRPELDRPSSPMRVPVAAGVSFTLRTGQ